MRSRSSRNWEDVGARGARWVWAKFTAGMMSPSGIRMTGRINSISCRRSNAKWSEESRSRSFAVSVSKRA